jgi:phosphoglycolate phosphatase-like HAD superfamily hydrolase
MAIPRASDVINRRYHIFDMDGTILDSFPEVAKIFAEVLAPHGVPAEAAKRYLYANTHQRVKVAIPALFAELGLPAPSTETNDAIYAEFGRLFDTSDAAFFPGAIRSLRALRPRVQGLFLSSLSPDALVERRLRNGGIHTGVFHEALGSTKFTKGPTHIERFAKHVSTRPGHFAKHAVFWGDTAFDMELAQAAGIYAIGIVGTLTAEQLVAAGADETTRSVAGRLNILFTG